MAKRAIRIPSMLCNGDRHGEYKSWHESGQLWAHYIWNKGRVHSEYKEWDHNGILKRHCFYINDKEVLFNEIPYPKTEEDYLYLELKYGIEFLPS